MIVDTGGHDQNTFIRKIRPIVADLPPQADKIRPKRRAWAKLCRQRPQIFFAMSKVTAPRALNNQERKRLRRIGHVLEPVVMLGQHGLTDAVVEETRRALADHELIKIKVMGNDREVKQQALTALAEQTGAQVVQQIGKVALLFLKAAQPNPHLSNLVRHAHLASD